MKQLLTTLTLLVVLVGCSQEEDKQKEPLQEQTASKHVDEKSKSTDNLLCE